MKSSFPSPNNYSQQSFFNDVHLWVILAFRNKCLSPWRTDCKRDARLPEYLTEHLTRYEPTIIFIQLCAAFFFKPFFGQLWGGESHTTHTHKKIYMRNRCRIQISNPQVALLYLRWVNSESSLLFYFLPTIKCHIETRQRMTLSH